MPDSLKINIVTIPEEGLNLVFPDDGNWWQTLLPEEESRDFFLQKAAVHCLVTKTGSSIFIQGEMTAVIEIGCSRCLENVNLPLVSEFSYTLLPAKPQDAQELELRADDLEISYYEGEFIDLQPLFHEQIILQIPIKPLCAEACKGLCPHCGVNLNIASCNCHVHPINERMAVLKNFKVNN